MLDQPAGTMIEEGYSFAPSLLLVGDRRPDAEAAGRLARMAGARIRGVLPPDEMLAWLDDNPPADAVLLEITTDHGALLDRLLDRLETDARAGRYAAVVAMPADLIDVVTARIAHGAISLLADATPADLVAALSLALAGAQTDPWVREEGTEAFRLRQLSEEVGRIARALAELSGDSGDARPLYRGPPGDNDAAPADDGVTAAELRAVIRGRRLRDQYFDSRLLADPAWDMLLDLAAARLESRRVAVSSLCIAAAVPATTALRWIKTLVEEGLFVRVADPRDGRRVFIQLSDTAQDGVHAYFHALDRAGLRAW